MHGSTKPAYRFEIEHLPGDMIEADRWMHWRSEFRDGKYTKVPYRVDGSGRASSTDPRSWAPFWKAADAAGDDAGIGFALGDGWLGVDFDDVADASAPNGMADWVWEWLITHHGYAEWSVSGTGIHVIARDTVLPSWSANRRGNLEIYSSGRYFTVSGNAIFRDRFACVPIQAAVDALCDARLRREPVEPVAPPMARTAAVAAPAYDASAGDWSVASAMAERGLPADVIASALRTKMREEGRGEKAARADYVPNTVAKAMATASRASLSKSLPSLSKSLQVVQPQVLEIRPFEKGEFPTAMREEIVGGLLRRGEVCNWIGAPKTGKSWLLHRLVLGMASGHGFTTKKQNDLFIQQGRVLLVDVELHRETLENRLHAVAQQMMVSADVCRANLDVIALRGVAGTLHDIEETVRSLPARTYQMICLDALYRLVPAGMRENENSDMTQIYNQIDRIALAADAAVLVVHHTTKGVQTEKGTMDVGAGAGAIGRATDTHVTFLRHADDDCIVMNAETRSFRRPEARVLHTNWPDIAFDSTRDATKLWNPSQKRTE